VPVFLGIGRTIGNAPAERLGSEKYQPLAANILIPKDSKRMVNVIRVSDDLKRGVAGEDSSMSVVLAAAYARESSDSLGWLPRIHSFIIGWLTRSALVDRIPVTRVGGLAVEDFLVDFSPLESMEPPLRTTNPAILRDPSQRKRFEGKVVLLGDATLGKATDTFLVPGRQQPYPGVFLHASAAYTVIKAPLFEVTRVGRLTLDVLFSLAILMAVSSVRLYYSNRTPEVPATHGLQGFFTVFVVLVAILGGICFVRFTRVMWDDCLLAVTALMFHPSIERYLKGSWVQARKYASGGWHRIVERGGEKRT
jgi:hypothetical protein